MFKNKIATKLITAFAGFVILCVLFLGVLFINIFASNHIRYRTESLMKAAKQISVMNEVTNNDSKKLLSENRLIEFLDYSADARIWIVDRNMDITVRSSGDLYDHAQMGNCLLPQNDIEFMQGVLSGNDMVSYANTAFYDLPMLSVGVPVYSNGEIIGAVLLHTSIKSLREPIRQTTLYLIMAILFSTVVIIIMGSFFAISFTRPLKIMKEVAGKMTGGDYSVKTNITKNDEIGDLANSMDVLAKRLAEAKSETERLEQLRQDFVANVSHEFRTPLTVIKGNIETLADTEIDDKQAFYSNIQKEVNALEKLVSDLLDLSRIESGRLELNIEKVDVKSVISDVVRSISPLAMQKNITIDTTGITQAIPPIYSDYYRLRQVLIIFLSNSIKYSDSNKKISIKADVTDFLTIRIKDNGFGISKEDLPYVWDRFFKSDKMRADSDSTGLGLAIAKNIVNLLGGEVTIQSELNVGSEIQITLPLGGIKMTSA
ncbi:MAG: Alkaline phosphatase synthesis sensor protein PhoR [Firmicutes bacterium ADurb.Bin193]|nr:MAG: Alkaline phosphatase synthesis sensor protein PhoR [Firmicutes bacterium ADurb.Bin193]